MAMARFRKWNNKISSADNLESIITQSLHHRITAVHYYLRLAAKRPHEDLNYVHRLRTWSRRSVVALKLYREVLPHKESTKLIKHLQKLRKAAGNARDYDVLIEKFKANNNKRDYQQILKFFQEKRTLAQTPIAEIYDKFEQGKRLTEQLALIKQHIPHSHHSVQEEECNIEGYIKSQLLPFVSKFFDSKPKTTYDLEGLHRFRINGRSLRYAMELTAFAFPQKFRSELYPEVENLQEKLGDIIDSAMLTRRIQYWIMSTVENELLSVFEQLYEREDAHLTYKLDKFQSKWHLEHIKSLETKFDDVMRDTYHQAVA